MFLFDLLSGLNYAATERSEELLSVRYPRLYRFMLNEAVSPLPILSQDRLRKLLARIQLLTFPGQ